MGTLNTSKSYARVVMTVFMAFMLYTLSGVSFSFAQTKLSTPTALKLGWEVSSQVYALRGKTFFEMIDTYSSLGIMNIEGLNQPGMNLSTTDNTIVDYNMSNDKLEKMKAYMAEKGMKMPSYYVGWGKDDWIKETKLWEFLKKLEVKVLCCEMVAGDLGKVKDLSQKYNIPIAIHNHTSGTSPVYYDPQKAIKALNNAGDLPHVGFCPDIGHWKRSNLDIMKSLIAYHKERPIYVIHARDIRSNGSDTALGTGNIPCKELFDSLYTWKWKGIITFDPDLQSKNLLRILDSSAHFIENFAKEKEKVPVLLYNVFPSVHQGITGLFITTGAASFTHKYRENVLYTITGKKLGRQGSAIPKWGAGNSPGVYIAR